MTRWAVAMAAESGMRPRISLLGKEHILQHESSLVERAEETVIRWNVAHSAPSAPRGAAQDTLVARQNGW